MRPILLVASAVGLIAAVILSSSASHRPLVAAGPGAAAPLSPIRPMPGLALASQVPHPTAQRTIAISSPRIAVTEARRSTPGSASMILAVDPETGQLGLPSSTLQRALSIEEMQALARAEAQGLATVRNPDGSETLNHEGRFADHSIVRVGGDGKPVFECVQGEQQRDHALHTTAAAPSPAEVR